MRGKAQEVQRLWGGRIATGARIQLLGDIMEVQRVERAQALKEFNCARSIQRRVRMFLGLRRLIHDNRVMVLVRAIEKTLMRFFIQRRCMRRRKAVGMLFKYCAEIAEAEGMRTVCQRFRVSVIKAQRVVRNFLAIRHTQVEMMERYWEVKDDKLHQIMVEKAAEKAKKGKKSQKAEEPPEYMEVPFDIQHEIIVEDIRNRRKSFDEMKGEREASAEMNAARDLIFGKNEVKTVGGGSNAFKLLPTEDAMFELIKKGQKLHQAAIAESMKNVPSP